MKNFVRLLVVVALAAAAVYWFKPEWWPFTGRKLQVGATHEQELSLPPPSETAPKLYKWTDGSGRVNVSDRPPTDGRPYETVQYDPDVNVIPAPQPAAPDPAAPKP